MTLTWRNLPMIVDGRVRAAAVLSLVTQILIVATGGAVRLTGSGLGCPTWPRCTADSFVATPEMGIHGVIEFGNRLLSFVLVLVALAMFVLVLRMRRSRPDLFSLSLAIGLGIPAQAVIGGISVLTQLNPWVVGLHFVLSTVLIVLCTVLVYRVFAGPRGQGSTVPRWFVALALANSVLVAITILVGIVTTGSGPHAGDANAPRNGLDSGWLQHAHSIPAYATLATTVLLVVAAVVLRHARLRRFTILLLAVELVQVVVGITQSRLGLPEILVGIHLVLATCLAAAMAAVLLSLRAPAARTATAGQFQWQ